MASANARIAAIAFILLVPGAVRASTVVPASDEGLTHAADAVVTGTVESVESVAAPGGGSIHTLVTVAVDEVLKGELAASHLTLREPGGRVGGRIQWVFGAPQFELGEEVLLFVSAAADGSAHVTHLALGKFRLVAARGTVMAERSPGALRLPSGGPLPMQREPLADLVARVRRAAAAEPAPPPRPLLRVLPLEALDTTLEREEHSAFTLMADARWFEPDSSLPVGYLVEEPGDPFLGTATSLGAVDAGLAAWTAVAGASIVLERAGSTGPARLECDGVSRIIFADPFNELDDPIDCQGILALGGFCASSTTRVVNGVTFNRIVEGDITFNNGFGACPFWNATNLAEVATHELGHTIGIGHSSEDSTESDTTLRDATMYFRAHFDGRGASLRSDDLAAVSFIYPAAGSGGDGGQAGGPDADADGVPDATDNCVTVANSAQGDLDGDGTGDACDPCPTRSDSSACRTLDLRSLRITLSRRGTRDRLKALATITPLSNNEAPALGSTLRMVLVGGEGVLLDAAPAATQQVVGARTRRKLRYHDRRLSIVLRRKKDSSYKARMRAKGIDLSGATADGLSLTLEVGSVPYTARLRCSTRRRGRRLTCTAD